MAKLERTQCYCGKIVKDGVIGGIIRNTCSYNNYEKYKPAPLFCNSKECQDKLKRLREDFKISLSDIDIKEDK